MCEPHLDLLPLTSRSLETLGACERPGNIPSVPASEHLFAMVIRVARLAAIFFVSREVIGTPIVVGAFRAKSRKLVDVRDGVESRPQAASARCRLFYLRLRTFT